MVLAQSSSTGDLLLSLLVSWLPCQDGRMTRPSHSEESTLSPSEAMLYKVRELYSRSYAAYCLRWLEARGREPPPGRKAGPCP